MLLEVNSHMSELSASVNGKQDVLEIIPMQLLLGGESNTRDHNKNVLNHCVVIVVVVIVVVDVHRGAVLSVHHSEQ